MDQLMSVIIKINLTTILVNKKLEQLSNSLSFLFFEIRIILLIQNSNIFVKNI